MLVQKCALEFVCNVIKRTRVWVLRVVFVVRQREQTNDRIALGSCRITDQMNGLDSVNRGARRCGHQLDRINPDELAELRRLLNLFGSSFPW